MARQLASAWVSVSPTGFADFGKQAKSGIEKALKAVRAVVPIGADDKPAVTEIDKLKVKLDQLARKRTDIKFNPKDKEAVAALASLNVKLDRINAKVANPRITLEGTTRVLADIAAVDLALDRLGKKTARPSLVSRALGGIGNLVPGLAGTSGGASGLGALAGTGLINPYTIIAALLAAPFAGQAAAGAGVLGLGGGLAGLGIAGALSGSKAPGTPAQVQAATAALAAAQLRAASAQDRLNKLQASGKTTAAQLAAAHAALTSAEGSVITAQAKVNSLASDATPAQQKMRAAFAETAKEAQSSFRQIGQAFVPVLTSLATAADGLIATLTPIFAKAERTIAGPFKLFSETLIASLGQPAVVAAIQAIAKAFGAILKALAPSLPSIVQTIADGIKRMADAVAKNPKAIADFVTWIFKLGGYALDAIAALTSVATYIEQHFVPAFKRARHDIAHWWDDLTNDIAKSWDIAKNRIAIVWDQIKLNFISNIRDIVGILAKLPGPLGAPFRRWKDDLGGVMSGIRNDIKRHVGQIQSDVNSLHGKTVDVGVHAHGSGGMTFTQKVAGAISSGGFSLRSLFAAGGLVRTGSGPTSDDVPAMLSRGEVVVPAHMVAGGAVDHLRGRLPGFAAGGIVGMPPWVATRETSFTQAVEGAMLRSEYAALRKAVAAAAKAAGSIGNYRPGAGVQQWRGVVSQALSLAGSSQQLVDAVLYQMQTESGGNPRAVNLWDSNAKAGHPSVGLMQVIRGTFQAYAGRYRNTGPFAYGVSENPLANVFAAIKYAQANYGPGLRNAYGGIGTGRGYALGGMVADQGTVLAPGLNLRWNGTGRPEPLVPAGSGGVHLHLTVTGPVGSQRELEDWFVKTANQTARTGRLTQAVKRAGRG